jgi:hypothetical protein
MLSVNYKPFKLSVVKLHVVMLSVTYEPFMLSGIMLNVVMLSVVAPVGSTLARKYYIRVDVSGSADTHT